MDKKMMNGGMLNYLLSYGVPNTAALRSRVTSNPLIMNGEPCIRGLRITVQTIIDLVTQQTTDSEILRLYPNLKRLDIVACLFYWAKESRHPVEPKIWIQAFRLFLEQCKSLNLVHLQNERELKLLLTLISPTPEEWLEIKHLIDELVKLTTPFQRSSL